MKLKIEFFKDDFINAIGAGVYRISVHNDNKVLKTLYVGESVFILVQCASHLYNLKKDPLLFGFTPDTIDDSNTKLIFTLLKNENDAYKRKKLEKEIINTEQLPLSQSGISDRLKPVEDRILALTDFLDNKSQ